MSQYLSLIRRMAPVYPSLYALQRGLVENTALTMVEAMHITTMLGLTDEHTKGRLN